METVKSNLETKTMVFLTKEDKIYLIVRMDVTKFELIDRIDAMRTELNEKINVTRIELIDKIDNFKTELIDRMNKLERRLTIWIISSFILNYILLMVSKKFF